MSPVKSSLTYSATPPPLSSLPVTPEQGVSRKIVAHFIVKNFWREPGLSNCYQQGTIKLGLVTEES